MRKRLDEWDDVLLDDVRTLLRREISDHGPRHVYGYALQLVETVRTERGAEPRPAPDEQELQEERDEEVGALASLYVLLAGLRQMAHGPVAVGQHLGRAVRELEAARSILYELRQAEEDLADEPAEKFVPEPLADLSAVAADCAAKAHLLDDTGVCSACGAHPYTAAGRGLWMRSVGTEVPSKAAVCAKVGHDWGGGICLRCMTPRLGPRNE